MDEFFKRQIIQGKAINGFLLFFAPVILVFTGMFIVINSHQIKNFIVLCILYPFPFVLIQLLWQKNVTDLVLKKINYDTTINYQRLYKLLNICVILAKGLIILSIIMAPIFYFRFDLIDDGFPIWLIIIWGIAVISMISLSIISLFIPHYFNTLINESESNLGDSSNGQVINSGFISPFKYFKIHRRIKNIVGDPPTQNRNDRDKDNYLK